MRAPFKKKVKQIGAKWLRGYVDKHQIPVPENSRGNTAMEANNQDPRFTPQATKMDGNIENAGRRAFQTKDKGGSQGDNYSRDFGMTDKDNYQKDFIIIESKKRRTEDGLDSTSTMDFNPVVQMITDENE
ncbi:hypothetical protein AgCh_006360 [Apium graveolens]